MVTSLPTSYPYRRDKLLIVGQGIDLDLFAPGGAAASDREESVGDEGDVPLVVYVGRLSPVKDVATLIDATKALLDRRSASFRVAIVGGPATPSDDAYVAMLVRRVRDLGLQHVVAFHPPVTPRAVASWYRRAAVVVNLTACGSGDKVALEAMACGRLCLVANADFGATLQDLTALLLFRAGDATDLADKLDRVLSLPPGERAPMGHRLRDQVARLHDRGVLATKLVAILADLSASPRRTRQQTPDAAPSRADRPGSVASGPSARELRS